MNNNTGNQRTITLEDISPVDFFGENNTKLHLMASYFPKLKIVGRGNQLIAMGEEEVIDTFEAKRIMENDGEDEKHTDKDGTILHGASGQPIKAHSANQQKIVDSIKDHDMLFAIGPAGTGKTYTSVALAVKALKEKQVRRIVLTRPAVEAGENLGFLPGDLKEKLDPYLQPLYDALRDMIPSEKLGSLMEKGVIQIAPLAFMRGRTLDGAFVILDEAQNTTTMQMKMFLTRMGPNAKFIITGDPGQVDLPSRQKSGLAEAVSLLAKVKGIAVVQLDDSDVIRHNLVKEIIKAYKNLEK